MVWMREEETVSYIKIWVNWQRFIELLPKILSLSSQKILVGDPGIRKKPLPDAGFWGQTGTGSRIRIRSTAISKLKTIKNLKNLPYLLVFRYGPGRQSRQQSLVRLNQLQQSILGCKKLTIFDGTYLGTVRAGSRVSRAWCGSTSCSRASSAGREREVSSLTLKISWNFPFFSHMHTIQCCESGSGLDPVDPDRYQFHAHVFSYFSWKFQYAV